jgi:hypothetical protein
MLAVHLIWGLIVGVFIETLLASKAARSGHYWAARSWEKRIASKDSQFGKPLKVENSRTRLEWGVTPSRDL